jgi:hypothetical protein
MWIDNLFGEGTYRDFVRTMKPELMLAAMSFSIVASAVARTMLFNTAVLPPAILGFFASGGVAFVVAYYIRRSRETT